MTLSTNTPDLKSPAHTFVSLQGLHKLFSARRIEEFLQVLYQATARKGQVKSLIFCDSSEDTGPLLYVCSRKKVFVRKIKNPPASPGPGFQKPEDLQYLTKALGRPLLPVFTLPLTSFRGKFSHSGILYVEFIKQNLPAGGRGFQHLLPVLRACVKRILRERHLQTSTRLWTKAFNELKEPLAIQEEPGELNLSNQFFKNLFPPQTQKANSFPTFIPHQNKMYEKHLYPVRLQNLNYTIYHYTDITPSLMTTNRVIQKARQQALEDLGESVAHQLNNPLTGVLSLTQLLLSEGRLNRDMQKDLTDISTAARRCQKIISHLLDFARRNSRLCVCDLNSIAQNTLPLLKSLLRSSPVQFQKHSGGPIWVKVQSCLLGQVIFNLIKNAVQAVSPLSPPHAKIRLQTQTLSHKAILRVEDSGPGVETQDLNHIFKPFFTTRSPHRGTGLGLNVSHRIVQSFKGRIRCTKSKTLGGACFTVELPLANL